MITLFNFELIAGDNKTDHHGLTYDFKGSRFFPCTRVCSREFIGNGNNFQSCIVSVIRPDLVHHKMRGKKCFYFDSPERTCSAFVTIVNASCICYTQQCRVYMDYKNMFSSINVSVNCSVCVVQLLSCFVWLCGHACMRAFLVLNPAPVGSLPRKET